MQTSEQRWADIKTIGDPPPLIPDIFLVNRDAACDKLKEVFADTMTQLKIDTRYPMQVADFVAAYIVTMERDDRVDAIGRCLILLIKYMVLCTEVIKLFKLIEYKPNNLGVWHYIL